MLGLAIFGRIECRFSGKKHFLFGLLIGLCLIFPLATRKAVAFENVNNLSFDLYPQENGMSNSQIHSIVQDKKG